MDSRILRASGAVAIALLVAVSVPGAANHAQTANGRTVTFDHMTGNEWWVELVLSGPDAASVAKVEAMDTNGPWVTLAKKSWGAYAASFRIEAGHQVAFRATWADGSVVASCWFTHPAGAEQCGSAPPPPPPPPSGEPVFDHKGGNEWWVEVKVFATVAPHEVYARDDGGAWVLLQLRSWGHWAGSFRIESGHTVQFRAVAHGSMSSAYDVESCRFTHPGGLTPTGSQACAGTPTGTPPPPPPPSAFDATFTGVKGNEWWVQASVAANEPVAKVQVRWTPANGEPGPWRDLAKHSWGWGASYPIPLGSLVQLRAQAQSGAMDYAANGWEWPWATVHPFPAPGTGFLADFRDVFGNANWVQANVYASEGTYGLGRVDVRVDGGAWTALDRQAWGDWAKALPLPEGSHVQFRAVSKDGEHMVESGVYVWPRSGPAPQWPVEGSHATYELHSAFRSGDYRQSVDATLELRYTGGAWRGTCTGTTTTEGSGPTTTVTWTAVASQAPPQVDPSMAIGTGFTTRVVFPDAMRQTCGSVEWTLTVERHGWMRSGLDEGDGPLHLRGDASGKPCGESNQSLALASEDRYGLVLSWKRGGCMSHMTAYGGVLVDTDAPIA